jgi:hypothetical protein
MKSYSFKKTGGVGAPEALLELLTSGGEGNARMIRSRGKMSCSQPPASILTTCASGIAARAAMIGHMLRECVQHHTLRRRREFILSGIYKLDT